MKILLVEDDRSLANLLQTTLNWQQYQVDMALDGQQGWELAEVFQYDLILLDVMLPKLDGISFCQQLRSGGHYAIHLPNQETPVLLMTAVDTVTNKVMGLDAGADDYLVKPINLDELLARIRALGRRGQVQRSSILSWGDLQLYPKNCEVTFAGNPISLTLKEYQLLELFLRYPDQIFSQSRLIEQLWAQHETPTENAVRAQIKGLRHKLRQAGVPDMIETIYKLGYRLRRPNQENGQQKNSLSLATPAAAATPVTIPSSELWEIWQECRQSYDDRVTIIDRAVTALKAGKLTRELQQQAEREAHTLIGSLGSFGLEEASQISRQIQQILKQPSLDYSEAKQLKELIKKLRLSMSGEYQIENTLEVTKNKATYLTSDSANLLIVDDDLILAEHIANEAITWGIQAEVATNLQQAKKLILKQQPDVVLLDLSFAEIGENGLEFLEELHNKYPEILVLVFTARDQLSDRVQAARLGSKGFLQKPIAPSQVLAAISQTLQQSHQTQSKILIVDDDPQILKLLKKVIENEDYNLILLDNAQQFWEVLEQTVPDLLILDVQLQSRSISNGVAATSELNGFDLCQIIRNDPLWHNLPILFLSGHTDSETVLHGFEAGADDFLYKPFVPAELLIRVKKRLEQGKIRRQTELDLLTGVSNRSKSMQDITRLLRLAVRQQQPFCLAVLDLDQFKLVNDRYGHEMGDRVLNCFGQLLNQSFRMEDVVGRWGGEEFVVGMYGISKEIGVKRLNKMLNSFKSIKFIDTNGSEFQVTFSAGISQFIEDGEDLQTLYRAADQTLYRAKHQGRNRVLATEN
ncbi:response regulator [Phormidium sp. LEGE 05292]|uniref:response regulator n=1 Tax=[Phormidium] sp. LEGE 05292 TaxID=767427 RepID=UPI00187E4B5B|nr:response regulator [Phormidium sp. LEGE 05292]MBE9228451.1 response regulator [Phormidium sp. LEGE 05292]